MTFEKIRQFNYRGQNFVKKNPTNGLTKLGLAIKKIGSESVEAIVKEYRNAHAEAYYTEVETVQIDNALVDEKTKAILSAPRDAERPYLYDREGLKRVLEAERHFAEVRNDAILKEWDSREFDITPIFTTDIPNDLTDEEIEAFKGFCIPEDYVKPVVVETPAELEKADSPETTS